MQLGHTCASHSRTRPAFAPMSVNQNSRNFTASTTRYTYACSGLLNLINLGSTLHVQEAFTSEVHETSHHHDHRCPYPCHWLTQFDGGRGWVFLVITLVGEQSERAKLLPVNLCIIVQINNILSRGWGHIQDPGPTHVLKAMRK